MLTAIATEVNMKFSMIPFKPMVAAAALAAGMAGSASAAVISFTTTGIINAGGFGDEIGIFGTPGGIISGKAYSLTTSFDYDETGYTSQTGRIEASGNASFHIMATVDGHSFSFQTVKSSSYSYATVENELSINWGFHDAVSVFGDGTDPTGTILASALNYVYSFSTPFVGPSNSLSKQLVHQVSGSEPNYSSFSLFDTVSNRSTYFEAYGMNIHWAYLNTTPSATAVPEPAPLALAGVGLLGMMLTRRKRDARRSI